MHPSASAFGLGIRQTLRGHHDWIAGIAWSADGQFLASGSGDKCVIIWDALNDSPGKVLMGHTEGVSCVAWSPARAALASGSADRTIRIWDTQHGTEERVLTGHSGFLRALAWIPETPLIASGSEDGSVRIWDATTGETTKEIRAGGDWVLALATSPSGEMLAIGYGSGAIRVLETSKWRVRARFHEHPSWVDSIAWHPAGQMFASGSGDRTIRIWEPGRKRSDQILEGHTKQVRCVSFSSDGTLLASKSDDGLVTIWRTDGWERLSSFPDAIGHEYWPPRIAFNPQRPLLATFGSDHTTLRIWTVDEVSLLRTRSETPSVRYTTAKIVLVGDSGVGKTGLGWRLAHGEFREHSSTHGQQFWPLPQLRRARRDGAECEAVLWDLAGQPDYRLIHALFLDDADLALVLFDPTSESDPLRGVEFWLKQLGVRKVTVNPGTGSGRAAILTAARADRGVPSLMPEEIDAYCGDRGLRAYVRTSARTGEGIDELVQQMQNAIPWDEKPATVTTTVFKRTKDFVLSLKESRHKAEAILTPSELSRRLQAAEPDVEFTEDEMLAAVGHLANHGYVARLKTSSGDVRILLAPELLNNLAASFVLEARRNQRGLGSLEEKTLLAGGYPFPELTGLSDADREILLDAAVALFLGRNICSRENDPLTSSAYLVFPELINLKKPVIDAGPPVEDGPAYTVSGSIENVFASLVVLLGYTHTFTRTNQWRHHARYEVGSGLVCGFRQEAEHEGELDFVLYFGTNVGAPIRTLFQSLFEAFLARRSLTVTRHEPVRCSRGHQLNRAIVSEAMRQHEEYVFCSKCGERLTLPTGAEPIQLTRETKTKVEVERRTAERRTLFEQTLFRLRTYVAQQSKPLQCFVSYAWGLNEHERWVEKQLATDLQKAGIDVVLDRWHNAQIGGSIARFVERVEQSDRIVMVGTPLYRRKYENKDTSTGYVVAAEVELIANRLLSTEEQKQSVLPLLLDGDKTTSLPPLLHGRVYADFRDHAKYFTTVFELILSLYQLPPNDPAVEDMRDSLRRPGHEVRRVTEGLSPT